MRHNLPLGKMSPAELLVHRKLEFLRAAGHRSSRRHVAARWAKLQRARRLAALRGWRRSHEFEVGEPGA